MKGNGCCVLGLLFLATGLLSGQERRSSLELEGNVVWNTLNDVAIPGDTGTRFSLTKTLGVPADLAWRLRLSHRLGKRHSLSLLWAPLSLRAEGNLPGTVFFKDRFFAEGSSVKALYRFHSYRLTYAWTWVETPRIRFQVGFTAKIRDAEIALTDREGTTSKENLGFVPLAHLAFAWKLNPRLHVLADLDALAAPQGRAEDLFVGLRWVLSPRVSCKIGYRTVEGGADVDSVYAFAWLHYLAAGIRVAF